jgi:L-serine deaminase
MSTKLPKYLIIIGILVGTSVSMLAIALKELVGITVSLPVILAIVAGICGVFAASKYQKMNINS